MKFTAKERDVDERCFVYQESTGLRFELRPPADADHAQAVARFLNENLDFEANARRGQK